ncbi:hypothetical protein XA68_13442 [Ophiocordyceps unilateralis]|uniref:Uncharacterized protein n=1 Tax=Ophiocordyceps unilateralis TaxID=268505 RepID=A0A2A9PAS2_OPHUN|nr:hypothetical protein XA68_13442 [Ophiocordyceps unilateralis]
MDAGFPWQTLHLSAPDYRGLQFKITDSKKTTVLYRCFPTTFGRPDLTLHRGNSTKESDELVGSISFDPWTETIETETPEGPVEMKTPSFRNCSYERVCNGSHEFVCNGSTWLWKQVGNRLECDLRLVDENGTLIARLTSSMWPVCRLATINVWKKLSPSMLDVVVVTALAEVESYHERENSAWQAVC